MRQAQPWYTKRAMYILEDPCIMPPMSKEKAMRYEIKILAGECGKVLEIHRRDSYASAMHLLDILTESVRNTDYIVDFWDLQPELD